MKQASDAYSQGKVGRIEYEADRRRYLDELVRIGEADESTVSPILSAICSSAMKPLDAGDVAARWIEMDTIRKALLVKLRQPGTQSSSD